MFWIVGASLRYAQAQRLPKGAVAYSGGSPVWLLPSQPHSFMDPAIRVFATLRHKYAFVLLSLPKGCDPSRPEATTHCHSYMSVKFSAVVASWF